ncbi:MAG: imelysin family protein [Methylobacterium sp.]|uniref:imelysin family protein n=1 Tax=Methylobacterium sp. TaxID=409 RepID=UPI00258ED6FF|nr:imelysin family protein [Methylobacterium sp.]MBY0299500.1 imelysin family protein [Methylobacterium sp.]
MIRRSESVRTSAAPVVRRRPTRRWLLGLAAAALVAPRARAAAPDHRATALRLARAFAVPRYRVLAEATAAQDAAWRTVAAGPRADAAGLDAAFQAAADAWAGIEMVRYGPVDEDSRYERMAHWPERRGAIGKALADLLAASDALTPERLRRASAAAQGLSALERLLYGEDPESTAALRRDLAGPVGDRRRALGAAIAQGLARHAAATLAGWTGPDGMTARLEGGSPEAAHEAVTRLATDHLAFLEAIADAKIGTVLGRSADEARPLAAEGWRAGRSLRAIRVNLDAADAFTRTALAQDAAALASVLAGLDTPRAVAGRLAAGTASLGDLAGDPQQRVRVLLLRDAVRSASAVSEPVLSEALGVTVGFNSRDGD